MKNIRSNAFALLSAVLLLAGCSSFQQPTQLLTVTCTPSRAVVVVNGQYYRPPVYLTLPRDRTVTIQCHKEGYVPYVKVVGTHLNTCGKLDSIGAGILLIPGIGLFSPGAWSLDETDVNITLLPQ